MKRPDIIFGLQVTAALIVALGLIGVIVGVAWHLLSKLL